eukprot:jgi/Psemu1/315199/fgenesh1_kg.1934_\
MVCIDGSMDGWMDGLMDGRAWLRGFPLRPSIAIRDAERGSIKLIGNECIQQTNQPTNQPTQQVI